MVLLQARTITWTNDGMVYKRINASFGLDDWKYLRLNINNLIYN